MDVLKDLKDMLKDDLRELKSKGNLNIAELEIVHKIIETIKYIEDICEKEGYNNDYSGRYMRRSYDDHGGYSGCSYGSSRMMDDDRYNQSFGRYSSYNRYSREGATSNMIERLREMMNQTTDEHEREAIRGCIDKLSW